MINTIYRRALPSALAALFGLAALAPLGTSQAWAQYVRVPVGQRVYYNGYGAPYNTGYSSGYDAYGTSRYGYSSSGYSMPYSRSGYSGSTYSGYGNGPYAFGSSNMFGYRSPGYFGYGTGTTYNLDYRSLRSDGRGYRRIYTPNAVRYYSPYGTRGY